ncbi:MAG TPA: ferritin family protein [bacterium]|nr:ferritin family protein [bacterium]HPO07884.1 ferritin family protein [bacterium]HQP99240.1 ferritin family protein [bacterium]
MNLFDHAMEQEKHAENLYRDLARKAPDPGFASILLMLADQEVKHYDILRKMKDQSANLSYVETDILPDAKAAFEKMQSGLKKFDFSGTQLDLYQQAQQFEAQSRDFYTERAGEAETDLQKEIFVRLAEEEKRHYFLLDNIIEFLSGPETWLENAEFNHLDEY